MEAIELLEECCRDHQQGKPNAEARLLALWGTVPILMARRARLAAAWITFREAVDEIAKPDFQPEINYTTFFHNRIERSVTNAKRQDKYAFGGSHSTVSRLRKAGRKVAYKSGLDAVLIADRETSRQEILANLRDAELTERQQQIVKLLAAGHTQVHVAEAVGVTDKTIRRELDAIKDHLLAV